jgi:hypothetical protein
LGQTCEEQAHTRNIPVVFTCLIGAAKNDFIDGIAFEIRTPNSFGNDFTC